MPTVELTSYAGLHARCEVAAPRGIEELAELFAQCRARGRRVTLRASGHSLDRQALNDDLVISVEHLAGLAFDVPRSRAYVGAATTWGEVVAAALANGHMPPILVSTSGASVGGTLSSNSLSRFSPVRGKEIEHVAAVELLTPTGELVTCSREARPELFRGVVGGFGYLGAVTRIAIALDPAPAVVRTRVLGVVPRAELLAGLLATREDPRDARTPTRFSVVLPGLARGLLYETTYLDEPRPLHRYRPVHTPRSPLNLLGELVLRGNLAARIVWWFAARTWSRRDYIDPVVDFTFFMDGNARAVRWGRELGCAMRCAEQTFVLPSAPLSRADDFLAIASEVFARATLTPSLTDVLHIPADDGVLSSTANLDGFAITFGFMTSRERVLARIADAFRALSAACGRLGGRVHLTKNVVADPEVLAGMYADALPVFRDLKASVDPDHVLRNAFLHANFPTLARA